MRVAIVGGCGFVGHNLALALDCEVFCLDSLSVNNLFDITAPNAFLEKQYRRICQERLDLLKDRKVFITDARDYDLMSHTLGVCKPDVIVHLAAVAHIDRSRKSPHTTFDHSLRTLENSLDCAVNLGARLIYFSSSTVYGDFSQPAIDELEPLTPKGTYGSLKQAGELMVTGYGHDKGLPYTIIRPQALYGPRCISRRVTQIFVENALQGKPLQIHGDGLSSHDFTHVDDVTGGLTTIINKEITGVFNLTNGQATSLDDLANIVADHFPETRIEYNPADDEKPSRGTMKCDKAWDAFGFLPKHDIHSGMRDYIDWYESFWPRT